MVVMAVKMVGVTHVEFQDQAGKPVLQQQS